MFHTLILHERFTQVTALGSVLVILGSMLIAFIGNTLPDVDYSLDQFVKCLKSNGFVSWIELLALLVLANMAICFAISKQQLVRFMVSLMQRLQNRVRGHPSLAIPINCMIDLLNRAHQNHALIIGIFLAITSGTLSSFSILLAKTALELLITNLHNLAKLLKDSTMVIIIFSFLTLGIFQLILLNFSIKIVSTKILYPLVFAIFNLVSILNYLIFYQQLSLINWANGVVLSLGTVSVISGVCLLSVSEDEEHHSLIIDDDDDQSFQSLEIANERTRLLSNEQQQLHNHSVEEDKTGNRVASTSTMASNGESMSLNDNSFLSPSSTTTAEGANNSFKKNLKNFRLSSLFSKLTSTASSSCQTAVEVVNSAVNTSNISVHNSIHGYTNGSHVAGKVGSIMTPTGHILKQPSDTSLRNDRDNDEYTRFTDLLLNDDNIHDMEDERVDNSFVSNYSNIHQADLDEAGDDDASPVSAKSQKISALL